MTTDALTKINRCQKLDLNAWVSYLVGYDSTGIYRIQNPRINKVVRLRDVTFDESSLFSGNAKEFKDNLLHLTKEQIEAFLRVCGVGEEKETNPI